jgi:hypothetical protein
MKPKPSPIPPEPLNPTSVPTSTPRPSSLSAAPTPVPATATPIIAAASQPYRSDQGGYAVDYPSDWAVNERVATDGTVITSFVPASGGASISIVVQPSELPMVAAEDPHTRCNEVQIGSLSGLRCIDTISLSISTTLVADGKTYRITTSGKGLTGDVYQRLVESFRLNS